MDGLTIKQSTEKDAGMIALTNVPDELKKIKQWNFSAGLAELRNPIYTKFEPQGGFTFEQAIKALKNSNNKLSAGFYVTLEDAYILGDLDKIKDPKNPWSELPPKLGFFLKQNPTYFEISPSGKGLRFVYKLESVKDKEQLIKGGTFYGTEERRGARRNHTQINISHPWMRMTGNKTEYSKNTVATISLSDISKCFTLKYKVSNIEDHGVKHLRKPTNVPSLSKMHSALSNIQLDQNPRIIRAFEKTFKTEYAHRELWLKAMASMHDYSRYYIDPLRCLSAVIDWSKTDPTSFKSEEDVQKVWSSFDTNKIDNVTYNTILSLDYYNKIIWPFPAKQTKEEIEGCFPLKPSLRQHENFIAFIDFYDIKIYSSELEYQVYYLTGDEDILEKNFILRGVKKHFDKYYGPFSEKMLKISFSMFLQKYDFFGVNHAQTKEYIQNTLLKTDYEVNLFKLYIDTPFHELPKEYQDNPENYEISTLDYLFNCIGIRYLRESPQEREQELNLYRKYYKCWLMGIIRGQYYTGPFKLNNCILILAGTENKFKSSHFAFILPEFFRDFVTQTTVGFSNETSLRELTIMGSQFLVIAWDDNITQYLTRENEPNFKRVIDNSGQAFRDKYETTISKSTPHAIYGATTNKYEFNMGDEGSRRMFIIGSTGVDTNRMLKICWHPILNELKDEMEKGPIDGVFPWNLTEDEVVFQLNLHRRLQARNSIDLVLEEFYNIDAPFRTTAEGKIPGVTNFNNDISGMLRTMSEVYRDLMARGIDVYKFSRPAMKRALHRLCGTYTKTQRTPKYITAPKCTINKGLASNTGSRKKWVMPPFYDEPNEERIEHGTDFA